MKKQSRKFSVSLQLGPKTHQWFLEAQKLANASGVDADLTSVVRGTLLKGMRLTVGECDSTLPPAPLSTHH